MGKEDSNSFVKQLADQNKEFCIIGLTGKVRSGTGDVRNLLTNPKFADLVTQPANTCGFSMSEIREHKIMYRYLKSNWRPFVEVNATSVIVSFVLDTIEEDEEAILSNEEDKKILEVINNALSMEWFYENIKERLQEVIQALCDSGGFHCRPQRILARCYEREQAALCRHRGHDRLQSGGTAYQGRRVCDLADLCGEPLLHH